MPKIDIDVIPDVKPNIKIDEALRNKFLNQVDEESQVIMHCSFTDTGYGHLLRVWKTTYLYSKDSSHKSKLIHVENITIAPNWMHVGGRETVNFTLIFSGLPKSCKHFDLIENTPTMRGFLVKNIPRNNSDVYSVDVSN